MTDINPLTSIVKPPGRLTFFLGPMFSGKTTEMFRELSRARVAGISCVLVRHAIDNRYDDKTNALRTHAGVVHRDTPSTKDLGSLRVVRVKTLAGVKLLPGEHTIGIDEGQFFPDLRDVLDVWMHDGHQIFVAALDGDYRRQMFAPIIQALPIASRFVKLSAICMLCERSVLSPRPADACYTSRTNADSTLLVVGDKEMYSATCLKCYNRNALTWLT